MDKNVPPGVAFLPDLIGDIEAPKGYDTVYGNNQGNRAKTVTISGPCATLVVA